MTPDPSSSQYMTARSSPEGQFGTPESASVSQSTTPKKKLVLSDLLDYQDYPWWETMTPGKTQAVDPMSYHVRTRINGQVGLLVDPGAHDNLIGSETCELMAEQLRTIATSKQLNKPLIVSGVGIRYIVAGS